MKLTTIGKKRKGLMDRCTRYGSQPCWCGAPGCRGRGDRLPDSNKNSREFSALRVEIKLAARRETKTQNEAHIDKAQAKRKSKKEAQRQAK